MKKIVFLFALAFLFAGVANAQTTATAQWNTADPLAMANTNSYTLKVDAAAPVTLTATCVLVNSVVTCSAPVVGWVPGVHTVVLTASNPNGSASTTVTTSNAPSVPTGLKVIVVIIG